MRESEYILPSTWEYLARSCKLERTIPRPFRPRKFMELKDYWQILQKNLAFIVFLAFLGALCAYLLTSNFGGGQQVQKHYLLIEETTPVGEFGSPVIFQESVDLTDTAVAILQTYDFKKEILANRENLIVKKEARQVLNLQAQASQKERAGEIIEAAAANFNGETANLFGRNSKIRLAEIGASYESLRPALDKKITTAFGFLLGAAFAVFAVGLKTYFKV